MSLKRSRSRNSTATRVSCAARADDGAAQAFGQQGAVGQAGQGVVVGQVAQFLLGALLVGDVVDHRDEVAAHAQRIAHFATSRSSPGIPRRPCAAATSRRPSGRCARGCRARGDRSPGCAGWSRAGCEFVADHFLLAVAGDAREGRVDRDEAEVQVDHRHRFAHAAQDFQRDAAFALGAAAGGDVARGAGHAQRAAGCIALDHLAARAHPDPVAVGAADAVLGIEELGVADDVLLQQLLHPRQVVGMDRIVAPLVRAHGLQRALAEQLVGAQPVQACCPGCSSPRIRRRSPTAPGSGATRVRGSGSCSVASCFASPADQPPEQPHQQDRRQQQGGLQ